MSEEQENVVEVDEQADLQPQDNKEETKNNKKKLRIRFWIGALVGYIFALSCVILYMLGQNFYYAYKYKKATGITEPGQTTEGTLSVVNEDTNVKMAAIQRLIDKNFYREVDEKTLEDGIFHGMLDCLEDPYSEYYSEEEMKKVMEDNEGIYYGIGAYVGLDKATQLPFISSVMPGTPAEEAGFREGDIIYKVDGVKMDGKSTSDCVNLIKGPEHTFVTITIVREGADDFIDLEVERRKIESPTVSSSMLDDNIAYIKISEFDDVTYDQFVDAYATLKGQGAEAMILDLRSNPGGSLSVACDIARQFLPEGMIVYTEDKYGRTSEYTCDGTREFGKPMVVLVNGYSASASEIVTGAVKDLKAGTIIGTQTYGKGIVQQIIPMNDGSAVKLTIANYFSPNGYNIHGVGIEPDIEVTLDIDKYYDEGIDNQKEEAINYLKKQMNK